jgi:hypothetical protein
VAQEDYDAMLSLIETHGGKNQGDTRAADGLRPEGQRSIYFFDPDTNRLQITAHAPNEEDEFMPDEEKWRRIVENRQKQGKGISSWSAGVKRTI